MLGRASLIGPVKIPRKWIQNLAATNAQKALHKVYRARVNVLLFGADRLLLTPRADTLQSYLMSKFSDEKFYNTYRGMAFMRLIRFSLERHLFDLALVFYDRMLGEGFLAVHSLSLRMAALRIVQKAKNMMAIVPSLKKLFEQDAYDVPAFMDLVHYLVDDHRASAALVDNIAHEFVSIRQIKLNEHPELVGELASINMRAGRPDAAEEWLRVFENTCGSQGILPDVVPYADIINTFNDIDPKNGGAIQDVLVRMKSAGVLPDANVFNALIRVNFAQHQHQEAFALYRVLMEKRSAELMPTDVTFKMLFRATDLLTRRRAARRHRPPENMVPPRKLFREMLTCHLEQTKGQLLGQSTVVSVSAFHLALRIFMARKDYAAAFIIVRVLQAFGFRPNLQTYLIVLVNILSRMKHEANLTPDGSYRLVDFLTHLQPNEDPDIRTLIDRIRSYQPALEHKGSFPIRVETMSHLLDLGEHARHTDDDLPHISTLPRLASRMQRHQRHKQVPTVGMLTGAEDPTLLKCAFFSPVPLARIVHRALLGDLFRKAVHRGTDWDWKGAVGPIIEETAQEMIPEGVVKASEASERLAEWREEQGTLPFAAARMRRRKRSARGGREIVFGFES